MQFSDYQAEAKKTDFTPTSGPESITVPLLGLAGEAGTLVSEYKKSLRDGDAYKLFNERVAEELGDALWYIATLASKMGLDLEDVAQKNLAKAKGRWVQRQGPQRLLGWHQHVYDSDYPPAEQLPRQMELVLRQSVIDGKAQTTVEWNDQQIGSSLTDNAYAPDGYRFHDVFHFAYAAVLAWSPIARSILNRQRRSNPAVDEVEDGGRAKVIEEGIAALVFAYARNHNFLEGVERVDFELLRTIRGMVAHLEVRDRAEGEWESAILKGFEVWRKVRQHEGGKIAIDISNQAIAFA